MTDAGSPAPDPSRAGIHRALRAAALYFALVFGTGFALGSIRVLLLVPRFGERLAELAEMPVMFLAMWFASRWVVNRFRLPPTAALRWGVGGSALLLMIAAELILAVALQDRALAEYIASRDPVSGGVYLALLAMFAALPWLQSRVGRHR